MIQNSLIKRARTGLPHTNHSIHQKMLKAFPHFFETIEYNNWFTIEPGLDVMYSDAGHIIEARQFMYG